MFIFARQSPEMETDTSRRFCWKGSRNDTCGRGGGRSKTGERDAELQCDEQTSQAILELGQYLGLLCPRVDLSWAVGSPRGHVSGRD